MRFFAVSTRRFTTVIGDILAVVIHAKEILYFDLRRKMGE
jgi:hypothetical protein